MQTKFKCKERQIIKVYKSLESRKSELVRELHAWEFAVSAFQSCASAQLATLPRLCYNACNLFA